MSKMMSFAAARLLLKRTALQVREELHVIEKRLSPFYLLKFRCS